MAKKKTKKKKTTRKKATSKKKKISAKKKVTRKKATAKKSSKPNKKAASPTVDKTSLTISEELFDGVPSIEKRVEPHLNDQEDTDSNQKNIAYDSHIGQFVKDQNEDDTEGSIEDEFILEPYEEDPLADELADDEDGHETQESIDFLDSTEEKDLDDDDHKEELDSDDFLKGSLGNPDDEEDEF